MVSRTLNDAFPNYERVIPKENDKSVRFGKTSLSKAIRGAALISAESMRSISFELSHNMLTVQSQSTDFGEAKQEISIAYTGEDIKIGFNADYFLDFLSACPSEDILISLKSESDQALIEPVFEGDKPYEYRYVVMPMRA